MQIIKCNFCISHFAFCIFKVQPDSDDLTPSFKSGGLPCSISCIKPTRCGLSTRISNGELIVLCEYASLQTDRPFVALANVDLISKQFPDRLEILLFIKDRFDGNS